MVERLHQDHIAEGEQLIKSGAVGELIFSQATYQVQIFDKGEEYWPFLQFASGIEHQLKDALCSCEEAEEFSSCAHLAAAYLKIYNGCRRPLHIRFQESLWHKLCWTLCEQVGGDLRAFQSPSEERMQVERDGTQLFDMHILSDQGRLLVRQLLTEREKETEENSIKFSGLNEKELELWHEGRPSLLLRYELSFWGDLAKHLMLGQESGADYQVSFEYEQEKFPCKILIQTKDLALSFDIRAIPLQDLVLPLSKVQSSLEVLGFHEQAIEKLTFHPEDGSIDLGWSQHVHATIQEWKSSGEQPLVVGEWSYVPYKGFYPLELPPTENASRLHAEQVASLFNLYPETVRKYLKEVEIHPHPVTPLYSIEVQKDWSLLIRMHLFEQGDLSDSRSWLFGKWAYLHGKGFFHLKDPLFSSVKTVIPEETVSDFVYQHRAWLNSFHGFTTHITNIDAHLAYSFDPQEGLYFLSKSEIAEDGSADSHDYGDWIYIYGEGFYSKARKRVGLMLSSGLHVPLKDLSTFIHMNKEELEFVDHFFFSEGPYEKIGLKAQFQPSGSLLIAPDLVLKKEYKRKKLFIRDDVVYCEGKGFYLLPKGQALPESYQKEVLVAPEEIHWFLSSELDGLRRYMTKIDPKLESPKQLHYQFKDVSLDRQQAQGAIWKLQLSMVSELGEVRLGDVWKEVHEKKRFLFTRAGLLDSNLEIFSWIKQLRARQVKARKNELQLTTMELLRFHALYEPSTEGLSAQSWERLQVALDLQPPSPIDTGELKSTLRPYQYAGANWLWFLHSYRLSGLLCDDMGLGKTHQTMALLAAAYAEGKAENKKKRFLIVCPTSVIFHWEEKLKEFLPSLSVYTYYREKRDLDAFQREYDILLTSYGLLRFDQKLFFPLTFDVAIFDEIQMAKNAYSQTFQVLSKLKTGMSLGLTGTPIENSLRELKNLFDLVLPGYMPKESSFKSFFLQPIEKEQDEHKQALLKRFIRPFVLRRKKEEVLADLPEKTEEHLHCYSSEEQSALYRNLLSERRASLLQELQATDHSVPYVHIFSLLTKLKQICNHPALFHSDIANYKKYESGKWNLFIDLLAQARESQQKVVVFSQFLGMLEIMQRYLEEQGIGYALLRGDTKDRAQQLRRFKEDPKTEVFLCSLKAGGLGIDLTAASVVIHYDRWWNAAREDQATDRVHRMGQMRGVQVFKLIVKQTLEERIDQIIEEKAELMEEVVETNSSTPQLDRQTLTELLNIIPQS